VSSDIGLLLRELRTVRRLSLNGLAERAGVAKGTLSHWETGAHRPRVPELLAVLDALGASGEQRERALALVDAPRAFARLRRMRQPQTVTAAAGPAASAAAADSTPGTGDLLRALRRRQGYPLQQVAELLKVRASTISRWEAGKTAVPEDRMDALLTVLKAHPEEQVFLTRRRGLLLAEPGGNDERSRLDACASEIAALAERAERGEHHLMDLRFLLLEARLCPAARRHSPARRLLAEAYAGHAQWLSYRGRIREAGPLAHRALDIAGREFAPESFWVQAVHVSVVYDRDVRRARPDHQVDFYGRWLPIAASAENESRLYRDMADAASTGGRFSTALDFIQRADEAARRGQSEASIALARGVHALVLERAGRPAEALRVLSEIPLGQGHYAYRNALKWLRLLLAVGERSEAQEWLRRAYEFAAVYDLSTEAADALARQLS
jgi:transcriptional regulator with XRE-family HTH domain